MGLTATSLSSAASAPRTGQPALPGGDEGGQAPQVTARRPPGPRCEKEKTIQFSRRIPRMIRIEASANGGFLVTLGCCRLAYTNHSDLLEDLSEYLDDPKGFEREYNALPGGIVPACGSSTSGEQQ